MEKSEKVVLLGVLINLVIFGIKYLASIASDSVALKAEAFHTFTDFIAAVTVFVGLKIAKRKTKAFPYGLYKMENLVSVVISFIVLYTGYEIVLEVMHTPSSDPKNSGVAILCLIVAILMTFWFSRYEKKVGQEINSPLLIADASHVHIDVLSNVVVLVAFISNLLGYAFDKLAALIIVGFIIKTGFEIMKDGAKVLLDASLDYDTLNKVEKIIVEIPQVVQLKALTGRNSGRFKFIEATIILKTHDLEKAHFIADKIERCIKDQIKNIHQVLIHYEPVQKETITYVFPLAEDQVSISSHFGEVKCFLFAIFKEKEKNAKQVYVLHNPYHQVEKAKGILAAEFLTKNNVDYVVAKSDFGNKGPAYVFANANINLILTDEETPKQALEKLGLYLSVDK